MAAKIPVNATLSGVALQTSTASKTANYTLSTADYLVKFDCTSGALTATLPDATTCAGQEFLLWKSDGSSNSLSINTTSSQNITGASAATSTFLAGQFDWLGVQSDGAGWLVVGHPGMVVSVFTSSGIWAKRLWTKLVDVNCWGGGGAGAAGTNNASIAFGGGGGGSGGGWSHGKYLASAFLASVTVAIAAQATSGSNGGTCTFGSYLTGYGGYAGSANGTYGAVPWGMGSTSGTGVTNAAPTYGEAGGLGAWTNGGSNSSAGYVGGDATGGGPGGGSGCAPITTGGGGAGGRCLLGGSGAGGMNLANSLGALGANGTTPSILLPGGGGGGGAGSSGAFTGQPGGNGGDAAGGGGGGSGRVSSPASVSGGNGGSPKCVIYENG